MQFIVRRNHPLFIAKTENLTEPLTTFKRPVCLFLHVFFFFFTRVKKKLGRKKNPEAFNPFAAERRSKKIVLPFLPPKQNEGSSSTY